MGASPEAPASPLEGETPAPRPKAPGRRKHRRRPSKQKRPRRPYLQLSWAEKQQRDERQSQRASRLRAQMFAKGQPAAPCNTTQFLMDDHDQEEPDLGAPPGPPRPGPGVEEAEAGDSDGRGRAQGEFLQRDFSETYERYQAESLQNMSKQDLIREYLELEKRLSRAEEEKRRLRRRRARELEAQVRGLRAQNRRLREEKEARGREAGGPGDEGAGS